MKTFDFRNFLYEKGFSFTNQGKTKFFHKKEAKFDIFEKGEKFEVNNEILDCPEDEEKAKSFLNIVFGEKTAKKQEKTDN